MANWRAWWKAHVWTWFAAHPYVDAFVTGGLWGLLMWLLSPVVGLGERSTLGLVTTLTIGLFGFGPSVVLYRRFRSR